MSTTETVSAVNEIVVSTTGSDNNSLEANVRSLTHDNISSTFPDVFSISTNEPKSGSTTGSEVDNDLFAGHDEEQIKLMDEVCIVLDWDDKPIGGASKKTCHLMSNINQGLLHRAFSVFLFNSNGELLLQQRADEKITFPSMWTNTCCSHPLAISTELGHDLPTSVAGVKQAAQRKLDQELGIKDHFVSGLEGIIMAIHN